MYILHYKIGGIDFSVHSDYAILSDTEWDRFAVSGDRADFLYDCKLAETMPTSGGKRYFDPIRNREYAVTQELENRMEIHLTNENLPWGSKISQLYPQLALPHILLRYKRLVLHASYILTERGAIVFTAPSGTGKSTQAELWKQHRNAFIVNGDRALIGISGDGVAAYGFPLSGSSGICRNETAKLLAAVSLKQGKTNEVRRLGASEALSVVINGSYLPTEYQADLAQLVDVALPIVQKVPVLELSCLPDESAVDALEYALQTL